MRRVSLQSDLVMASPGSRTTPHAALSVDYLPDVVLTWTSVVRPHFELANRSPT